ncbi:inositol monophosphatase family protein [Marichromatium bheemlicum]|uniref:Inositol monophosphatase family protein n=1 Tax=Marichromatium bheemlicum TaxID=365339 RepID=A0ABX1I8W4_9GAMM|nr:inositol monophosphatase family protein [Marichromatium bheemlicum]NKN33962.1 inositol monophosphatase family protein [Marichromatium bheemlicum]
MSPDPIRLSALLREVARTEILPRWGRIEADTKGDGSLVTSADLAVQQRLTKALAAAYPDIALLGEEMTEATQQQRLSQSSQGVWVLDPIDGTGNYACGFPGFAISLALVRNGRVELGVVLDPVRDECFCARRGGGATLNARPIAPFTPGQTLGDCIAMVDFKRLPPERIPTLLRPGGFRSQRNLGTVALEWCWLACGRFQLYLHGGQKLWDYAAGWLIAREAGVAAQLYRQGETTPLETIDLGARVALAAADQVLLEHWRTFVELPLSET